MTERTRISSGSPWESEVGYSRAVRVRNRIYVAGTTSSDTEGNVVAPGDAYRQTQFVLKRIGLALAEAGAGFEHVVRTRMFVTDISRWVEYSRAHGEVFRDIRPVSTMVEVKGLITPGMLIEIEVDAEL